MIQITNTLKILIRGDFSCTDALPNILKMEFKRAAL